MDSKSFILLIFSSGLLLGAISGYFVPRKPLQEDAEQAVSPARSSPSLRLAGSRSQSSPSENSPDIRDRETKEENGFEDTKATADRLIDEGKAQEAVGVLQDAFSEFPDDPHLQAELGFALIEADQVDQARQIFEKKLADDPNDPEARLGIGIIDRLNGKTDEAMKGFAEALRLDPDNADAKFNISEMLAFERGNTGTVAEKYFAEKNYMDLLQDRPDNPDLQNGLAAVYLSTGRVDQAIGLWERTVQGNPDDSILMSNLGEAYVTAGRPDDAISISQKALEKDSSNGDAYFFMGSAQIAKGDTAAGIEAIQKAIALEPDNPQYLNKLKEFGNQ